MDCLGHSWFTGARKQETVLVHMLRLTDRCPEGVWEPTAAREMQCVMLGHPKPPSRRVQETILWAQVSPGWWVGYRRESGSPCCWVAWGAPVSEIGGQWRGGPWVQVRALRF